MPFLKNPYFRFLLAHCILMFNIWRSLIFKDSIKNYREHKGSQSFISNVLFLSLTNFVRIFWVLKTPIFIYLISKMLVKKFHLHNFCNRHGYQRLDYSMCLKKSREASKWTDIGIHVPLQYQNYIFTFFYFNFKGINSKRLQYGKNEKK